MSEWGRSDAVSCFRWSEPRIMIVCGLPALALSTAPPSDGIVCPWVWRKPDSSATWSRIAEDTATVVRASTITLPSRNFLYIPRADSVRTGPRVLARSG